MDGHNTRSGKKHKRANTKEQVVEKVVSSPNEDDAVSVHPNEDDYAAVGMDGAGESDIANMTMIDIDESQQGAVSNAMAAAVNRTRQQGPNAFSGPNVFTMESQSSQQVAASYAMPAVVNHSSGAIREDPPRIYIDQALNPQDIREFVEVDGRRLENVVQDSNAYHASIGNHRRQERMNREDVMHAPMRSASVQSIMKSSASLRYTPLYGGASRSNITTSSSTKETTSHVAGLKRFWAEVQKPEFAQQGKFAFQSRLKCS